MNEAFETKDMGEWVDVPSSVFGADFLIDPYPVYKYLRDLGRVVRMVDGENGVWVFSHYDDVAAIQQDKRFLSRRTPQLLRIIPPENHKEFEFLAEIVDMWVVSHDGDKHMRQRKVINHGFTSYALSKQEADIAASVHMLIDKVIDKGHMEFVKDFAHPLPAMVIMRILGVPQDELPEYMTWSDALVAFAGGIRTGDLTVARQAQSALKEMMERFGSLIEVRKTEPQDDLISHMMAAKSEDGTPLMGDRELAAQCCLLLLNGNETTRNLLSSTLLLLFSHPEQKRILDNEPEYLTEVVEEVLRYESPAQLIRRVAGEDINYLGAPICEGDSVLLLLGSANHDPSHYSDQDCFDVNRKDKRHMSFGYGPHFCVGAALSRLEAKVALSILFERLPHLDLVEKNPPWNMNPAFRGLAALNLRF